MIRLTRPVSTGRTGGRLVFASRQIGLWEQTFDCGPELRSLQDRLQGKLRFLNANEFDKALRSIQQKYPRDSWEWRLGQSLRGGLEVGRQRYGQWLKIFEFLISQLPHFQNFETLLGHFMAIVDDLIPRCRPRIDLPDPCGPCTSEILGKYGQFKSFLEQHYRGHSETYPSPGQMFEVPTIEPGLIAEILTGVLLTAILAILITKLPPPLFQGATQLVQGARPALAAALTVVAASVMGSPQEGDDIQQLVDRVRLSQEFSDLADTEAQSFLEQLLPPPSIACPPLEGVIEDALTQVTSENPAISNPCENARIVEGGASLKIDQLRQAYGEGCPRAELLLQDLRQAIDTHCSS